MASSQTQHSSTEKQTETHDRLQVHGFAAYTLPTGAKYEGEQGAWLSWLGPDPIDTVYSPLEL